MYVQHSNIYVQVSRWKHQSTCGAAVFDAHTMLAELAGRQDQIEMVLDHCRRALAAVESDANEDRRIFAHQNMASACETAGDEAGAAEHRVDN